MPENTSAARASELQAPSREEYVAHWLEHWREVRTDARRIASGGFLRIRDRGDLEMALMVADKLADLLAEEVRG